MRIYLLLFVLVLVAGCASNNLREEEQNTAIRDLIEVNDLEELDALRFFRQLGSYEINRYYVIVTDRRNTYLIEYFQRCMEDVYGRVEPDYRNDPRTIRPKSDTFRGCRIKAIYAINEALEAELKQIGKAPGEK